MPKLCVNTKTDAAITFFKTSGYNIYVGIPHTGDLGVGKKAVRKILHKVSCQIIVIITISR